MNNFRYKLEHGSQKHICPQCRKKTFVYYVDIETSKYLPEQYGRCDRESKCTYHLNPYLDGYAKMKQEPWQSSDNLKSQKITFQQKLTSMPDPVFIPIDVFKLTLQSERYEQNTFIQNLLTNVAFPFERKDIERVISQYYLGTITKGYRAGAITFPFIDINKNVRTVQVKQFDETNHTLGTDFLHSIIEKHHIRNHKLLPEWLVAYNRNERIVSCLFGSHLLQKYPHNPVALVEAPKTAIYSTLYFGFPELRDNLLWLAVYNKSSFSFDKLKVLKGRNVFVFPDLSVNGNTFNEWQKKAMEYEAWLPGTRFIVSDLLERSVNDEERLKGLDLADYLIRFDWRQFRIKPKVKQVNVDPLPEEAVIYDLSHWVNSINLFSSLYDHP